MLATAEEELVTPTFNTNQFAQSLSPLYPSSEDDDDLPQNLNFPPNRPPLIYTVPKQIGVHQPITQKPTLDDPELITLDNPNDEDDPLPDITKPTKQEIAEKEVKELIQSIIDT